MFHSFPSCNEEKVWDRIYRNVLWSLELGLNPDALLERRVLRNGWWRTRLCAPVCVSIVGFGLFVHLLYSLLLRFAQQGVQICVVSVPDWTTPTCVSFECHLCSSQSWDVHSPSYGYFGPSAGVPWRAHPRVSVVVETAVKAVQSRPALQRDSPTYSVRPCGTVLDDYRRQRFFRLPT